MAARRSIELGLVGVLLAAGLAPGAARAAEPAAAGTSAVCTAHIPLLIDPGIGLTPAEFIYSSGGPKGAFRCAGTIDGHRITGFGTVTDSGTAMGSCSGGRISGSLLALIPTDAGRVTRLIPVEATYTLIRGTRTGPEYPGGFTFVPLKGDCISSPVSQVIALVDGLLVS